MLPLRNATPSSPSNISQPAQNEVHSGVRMPQSCLPANCDPFLLQRTPMKDKYLPSVESSVTCDVGKKKLL